MPESRVVPCPLVILKPNPPVATSTDAGNNTWDERGTAPPKPSKANELAAADLLQLNRTSLVSFAEKVEAAPKVKVCKEKGVIVTVLRAKPFPRVRLSEGA